MKFECKKCGHYCVAKSDFKPIQCLYGGDGIWHEVTARAPKPLSEAVKLPKLTVEVFDREDCPEWAKYAAVDSDGSAFYYSCCLSFNKTQWNGMGGCVKIPGLFDPTDWQKSLIERPAKEISKEDVEKFVKNNLNQGYLLVDGELKPIENKLPDWVKVGAWVYDEPLRQYEHITEVNNTSFVTTHCTRYSVTGLKPARVRPWTFEEAPLGFKTKDDVFILLYIQDKQEWGYWAKKECEEYTLAEVAKEQIQLSGSPCGVLTTENEEN